MKFKNLFKKHDEYKGYLQINILNNTPLTKEQRKQIEKIAIVGTNCGDSLKNISLEISKQLKLDNVQVYRHYSRIDIVI